MEPEQPVQKELETDLTVFHTLHDHYHTWGALTPYGLRDVLCSCGHGCQIDPTLFTLEDGVIVPLKNQI